MRFGGADPARADKSPGLLCAGLSQDKIRHSNDKTHFAAGDSGRLPERGFRYRQPVYPGGRQLFRLADGQGQLGRRQRGCPDL